MGNWIAPSCWKQLRAYRKVENDEEVPSGAIELHASAIDELTEVNRQGESLRVVIRRKQQDPDAKPAEWEPVYASIIADLHTRRRFGLMNLEDANRVLQTHRYTVSMTQQEKALGKLKQTMVQPKDVQRSAKKVNKMRAEMSNAKISIIGSTRKNDDERSDLKSNEEDEEADAESAATEANGTRNNSDLISAFMQEAPPAVRVEHVPEPIIVPLVVKSRARATERELVSV